MICYLISNFLYCFWCILCRLLPMGWLVATDAVPCACAQWCDVLMLQSHVDQTSTWSGISVGAEFSAAGAEFSAVVGDRVLRGAEFSAGPTSPWGRGFGLGRVLRGAEFSGIRHKSLFSPFKKLTHVLTEALAKHVLPRRNRPDNEVA